MIRHSENIKEQTYRNVGLLMTLIYAITVFPMSLIGFEGNMFFLLLLTIPLFTIILAGEIGYHGHRKESLISILSITSSQILFLVGVLTVDLTSTIFIAAGFVAFLLIPWILFIKVFLEYQFEED